MNYCPHCGQPLETRLVGGRERPACSTDHCNFVHFGHYSIGCGGVVIRDGKLLLVQRGIEPNRGAWQIPGGYVECDEEITAAVQREVLEETGVVAQVSDLVAVRHTAGNPNANIYVVFRLDHLSGEPVTEGEETMNSGYFSYDEVLQMERLQGMSLWAYQRSLEIPHGSGLVLDQSDMSRRRPGWSLFGLMRPEG